MLINVRLVFKGWQKDSKRQFMCEAEMRDIDRMILKQTD